MTSTPAPWWRHAVCYQVYVRSFADADGDGIGDLPGITSRLPYLAELGVDAVWLTPFYRSPQADHGYDVADYRDVDPMFGDLAAFDEMLSSAHGLGLKVLVDIVPNHSSDQHVWFQQALAAAPGGPERARYVFRDGRGADGTEPPNNWRSTFGGPAWTRVPDGQWYLHLFDAGQPDFDWTNPDVGDEFESVLRFWLDRGADGFRIDVAHGLAKADGLPDLSAAELDSERLGREGADAEHLLALELVSLHTRPYWDQPAVHDVYRRWHRVLAEYPGDRMAIAESWVPDAESMARYVRPDELQQVFNFHWLEAQWSAPDMRRVLAHTFAATEPVGASPTWVLSNHDVVRAVSRYGGGALGTDRARAALLAMLALPGSAYLYQGEELGLPQVDVPPAARQDPVWHRGGGVGRDGCRVPIPWTVGGRTYGFSPAGAAEPWLPQPPGWGELSVEAQRDQDGSTWRLVQRALSLRRRLLPGLADAVSAPDDVGEDAFVVRRAGADGPGLTVVVGCGASPVDLARLGLDGVDPLLVSGPDAVVDGRLRADAAAWFRAG